MPKTQEQKEQNKMREVEIKKVIVQCCVGGEGDQVTKAAKVLEQLSGQKPAFGKSRLTVRNFGIRRGQKISAKVTIRGDKARETLEKGLRVKSYTLSESCFSPAGFGFGISEHIDLGIKYDPQIGIFGMDFIVVLGRKGERVSKRKRLNAKVGRFHKLTTEDSIAFAKEKFQMIIRD